MGNKRCAGQSIRCPHYQTLTAAEALEIAVAEALEATTANVPSMWCKFR